MHKWGKKQHLKISIEKKVCWCFCPIFFFYIPKVCLNFYDSNASGSVSSTEFFVFEAQSYSLSLPNRWSCFVIATSTIGWKTAWGSSSKMSSAWLGAEISVLILCVACDRASFSCFCDLFGLTKTPTLPVKGCFITETDEVPFEAGLSHHREILRLACVAFIDNDCHCHDCN